MPSFADLGLSGPVLRAVTRAGYEEPTPIQAQAIPEALNGRDIIGASQTGTGKTAAFSLPIVSKLGPATKPQVLVLEPTRELAAQVEDQMNVFGYYKPMNVVLIHGGVGYGHQIEALESKPDVILATPGRLLDHLEKGNLDLSEVKYLVLDEVDRMLDMGFLPDVKKIIDQCPKGRQTLFFSATMPAAIQTLAQWALNDPISIEVGGRRSPAETVSHAFYPVGMDQRDDLILALVEKTKYESIMIFTRTKKEADQLLARLKDIEGTNPVALHSDIKQSDRTKALQGFRDGTFNIIVATDIAARGLDVSGVTHVINYRVPENPEDYVHRIGRTGRAQQEGDAFTILTADELENAAAVEHFVDQKIERRKLEGFNYNYTALLDDSPAAPLRRKRPPGRKRR
ncbi:DEAD/DEAH box helicase [Verrucomicrobiales bacterium BCK34]|nr:DEAD/DEAH box helicase [Verrucomicrobiales bacterium BCK34]